MCGGVGEEKCFKWVSFSILLGEGENVVKNRKPQTNECKIIAAISQAQNPFRWPFPFEQSDGAFKSGMPSN